MGEAGGVDQEWSDRVGDTRGNLLESRPATAITLGWSSKVTMTQVEP